MPDVETNTWVPRAYVRFRVNRCVWLGEMDQLRLFICLFFSTYIMNLFFIGTSASGRIDDTERKGKQVVNWTKNEWRKIGDNETNCISSQLCSFYGKSIISFPSAPNATQKPLNATNKTIYFKTRCSRFIVRLEPSSQVSSTQTPKSIKMNIYKYSIAPKKK